MSADNSVIPFGIFCTDNDKLISAKVMKLKGFDWASRELSKSRYEKFARQSYSSNCSRINAQTMPELAAGIAETCNTLGIPVPTTYLQNSTTPCAFCIGETDPILIVSSELCKLLTPAEVKVITTQALLHIHCEHLKSYMVRDLLRSAADNFGLFKGVVAFPRMLLEEWTVEADLSADRGMLVLAQDLDLVFSAYAKIISGGVVELSVESILADYEAFMDNCAQTPLCPLFKTWSDLYLGNTRYIYRLGRLKEFAQSQEFAAWSSGDYAYSTDTSEDFAEDEVEYFGEYDTKGEAWEAEDVHARIAWGFPDPKATAEFLRIHVGDIFKLGIDGARDFTADMVASLNDFFSVRRKKD